MIVTTYTGKAVDLLNPHPDTICIEDIAHALSLMCLRGGHTDTFTSYAMLALARFRSVEPRFKLWSLLCYAHHAYLPDTNGICHQLLGHAYTRLESMLLKAIRVKFGLGGTFPIMEYHDPRLVAVEFGLFRPKEIEKFYLNAFHSTINEPGNVPANL